VKNKEKYNQRNRTNKIYNLDIVSPYMNTNDFWEMPIISKDNYIPERLIGFNEALTSKAYDACVHFFLDDYQFERIWKEPRRYVDVLKRFSGVCSPDFSLYLDMPTPLRIYNTYRSRLVGQYLQSQGLRVIPTISWATEDSFKYCFKGIPKGSIVAISTLGVKNNPKALGIWQAGKKELINQVEPSVILIYGGKVETEESKVKIIWFENHTIKRMKGK
jgi:hypothetical protein